MIIDPLSIVGLLVGAAVAVLVVLLCRGGCCVHNCE